MTDATYVDSAGNRRPAMSFSEALEVVHSLATQNQVDENDVAFGDGGLPAMRERQTTALDALHDLVVNHGETVDELEAPVASREWPRETVRFDPSSDASDPVNAIKCCLDMAEQGRLSDGQADGDDDLEEEVARQGQAFDTTRDLLGMHATALTFGAPAAVR